MWKGNYVSSGHGKTTQRNFKMLLMLSSMKVKLFFVKYIWLHINCYAFKPKYQHSKETKHLRIPVEYKDLVGDLMVAIDKRFDVPKGRHILRKFIDNLS